MSSHEVSEFFGKHYHRLYLFDEAGHFHSFLEEHENALLPDNPQLLDMVQQMVDNAFAHPVLKVYFEEFDRRIEELDDEAIKEIVTYSYVLNTLTEIELKSNDVAYALVAHWSKTREKLGWRQGTGLLDLPIRHKQKLVEEGVLKLLDFRKTGQLDVPYIAKILPENIAHARRLDEWYYGNFSNRPVGRTLQHYARRIEKLEFSANGEKIYFFVNTPEPGWWERLYHTWNVSFVLNLNTYPIWLAKLLIPSVSNCLNDPSDPEVRGYLMPRSLALYTTMMYVHFTNVANKRNDETRRQFRPKKNLAREAREIAKLNAKYRLRQIAF